MSPQTIARIVGVAIFIFVVLIMASSGTYVVHPGYRGVEVVMGKVTSVPKKEGFGLKMPLITRVEPVSIRQQTAEDKAECYSADLQQIHIELRVLFRIPEASVVTLYQGYEGDAFQSLVAPRIHEALKEVAAMQSAEQIVKNREQIKTKALDLAKQKLGNRRRSAPSTSSSAPRSRPTPRSSRHAARRNRFASGARP
jgi:prohibitin 2